MAAAVLPPAEVEKFVRGLGKLLPREAVAALANEVRRQQMDGTRFASLVASRGSLQLGDVVRPRDMATLRRCWNASYPSAGAEDASGVFRSSTPCSVAGSRAPGLSPSSGGASPKVYGGGCNADGGAGNPFGIGLPAGRGPHSSNLGAGCGRGGRSVDSRNVSAGSMVGSTAGSATTANLGVKARSLSRLDIGGQRFWEAPASSSQNQQGHSAFAPPPRARGDSGGSKSCHVPPGIGAASRLFGANVGGGGCAAAQPGKVVAVPATDSVGGCRISTARLEEPMPQFLTHMVEEPASPMSPMGLGMDSDAELSGGEDLNTWRKEVFIKTHKPPQVPRLDLTAIHRNAGQRGEAAFLNSHHWRAPHSQAQVAKDPSYLKPEFKMPAGFSAATAEDQQRIAEFYGYRDEGFIATMHGLRTDLIRPRFYLGTMADAAYWPLLKALGITHILNCAIEAQRAPPPYESHGINYMLVPLYDSVDQAQVLQRQRFRTVRECTKFVSTILKSTNKRNSILVHCVQGLSRSAMIAAAYLMEYEGLDLDRALTEVRTKHPGCLAAPHWMSFLYKYNAQVLRGL